MLRRSVHGKCPIDMQSSRRYKIIKTEPGETETAVTTAAPESTKSTGGDFTSNGLKEVIMSLEEALHEYHKPAEVKDEVDDEQVEDYFGREEPDEGADDGGEEEEEDLEEDYESGDDDSDLYDPATDSLAGRRRAKALSLRRPKKKRPWPKSRNNMTYSQEQRVRMGFFAAKWGVKAMKKKYSGVKDSTARDMCKYVMSLVRDGLICLDVPLEQQAIPPKLRKGVPTLPSQQAYANNDESSPSLSPEPVSSHQQLQNKNEGGTDQARASPKRCSVSSGNPPLAETSTETGAHSSMPISTSHGGDVPPPHALSFEDKSRIGFLAAVQGSSVAVKKCDVSETAVKECRNMVIRLVQSGKLCLNIPLEDQEMPEDPDKTTTSRPARRGRPPKNAGGKNNSPLYQLRAPVGNNRVTTVHSPPQTPPSARGENLTEASQSSNPFRPPEIVPSTNRSTNGQMQANSKDISLVTDLAFLRWRNRRIALGFQSDQAFAMHLMDVHDAFCSGQCSRGVRQENVSEAVNM